MGGYSFGSSLDPLGPGQPNAGVIPPQRPPAPVQPPQAAPLDPAVLESRRSGWDKFFTRLASDKNLQQTLINSGAQLLQPRQRGQSQAGAIGGALAGGTNLYSQLNQQDANRAERTATRQQQLDLQGRGVAATEQNAATNASEATANAGYRQQVLAADAAKAPTAQERQLEMNKTGAEIKKLNAEAASAGTNVSIGAEESLIRLNAAALMDKNPALKESDAILQSVREIKTMGKVNKTSAEFEASLMGKMGAAMAIMPPEERAATQQKITDLVGQYQAEMNPQGAGPATPTNEEQTAGDAAWQRALAKKPNMSAMEAQAVMQHILQYAPSWKPPQANSASGTIQR